MAEVRPSVKSFPPLVASSPAEESAPRTLLYFNENLDKGEETLRVNAESIVRAYDPCMSCVTNFLKIDWIRR